MSLVDHVFFQEMYTITKSSVLDSTTNHETIKSEQHSWHGDGSKTSRMQEFQFLNLSPFYLGNINIKMIF